MKPGLQACFSRSKRPIRQRSCDGYADCSLVTAVRGHGMFSGHCPQLPPVFLSLCLCAYKSHASLSLCGDDTAPQTTCVTLPPPPPPTLISTPTLPNIVLGHTTRSAIRRSLLRMPAASRRANHIAPPLPLGTSALPAAPGPARPALTDKPPSSPGRAGQASAWRADTSGKICRQLPVAPG